MRKKTIHLFLLSLFIFSINSGCIKEHKGRDFYVYGVYTQSLIGIEEGEVIVFLKDDPLGVPLSGAKVYLNGDELREYEGVYRTHCIFSAYDTLNLRIETPQGDAWSKVIFPPSPEVILQVDTVGKNLFASWRKVPIANFYEVSVLIEREVVFNTFLTDTSITLDLSNIPSDRALLVVSSVAGPELFEKGFSSNVYGDGWGVFMAKHLCYRSFSIR
jgi:hypothetical protein